MLAPLSSLVLLTGLVFLIIWAARFATRHQLKTAISWFLAVGILGTLLGSAFGSSFCRLGAGSWGMHAPSRMMQGTGNLQNTKGRVGRLPVGANRLPGSASSAAQQ